jgi:hypothetical protein
MFLFLMANFSIDQNISIIINFIIQENYFDKKKIRQKKISINLFAQKSLFASVKRNKIFLKNKEQK